MATSGSTNFSVTRDDIIKAALRKAGALGLWENPTTEATTAAAFALNTIVKRMSTMGMPLWKIQQTDIDGADFTNSQVFMGIGETIDVPKPLKILSAEWNMNDTDTQLEVVDRRTFMQYSHPTTTGTPYMMYFQPLRARSLIIMYPYLDTYAIDNGTLKLQYEFLIEDFDASSDELDFPIEWAQLVIYELACDLAPEYALAGDERRLLLQERSDLREQSKTFDVEQGSVFLQPSNG